MPMMKCESCGAVMNADGNRSILYCPYCGFSLKQPETAVDYAKFVLQHNEEVRQRIRKEKTEDEKRKNRSDWLWIVVWIMLLAASFAGISYTNPERKLNNTVAHVQQLILEEKYEEALVEAQTIRVEKKSLFDSNYGRWENQRKDLIRLIEQKQKEK